MLKKYPLLLVFAITLFDIIVGNGLGALVADYVINLPAKPIMLTGGIAVTLAIQLAFSPAIGQWSDKRGRRPAVIATTIVSLFTSLLLLPLQTWGYVLNRCFKGVTNGLDSVMRSSVSDLTEKDEFLKYSGLLSFIIGAGPIIGAMGTGWLMLVYSGGRISPLPTVILLLALGLLNIGLAFFFKETNPKKEPVEVKELAQKAANSLKVVTLWKQLTAADKELPGVKLVFILNMIATLGMGYYAYFVAFLTESDLMMTPRETAWFFLYFGCIAILANIIFFTFIAHRVNKRKVIIFLALLSVGLQVLYTFSESSMTLLYVVAGVDALTVSIITGLTGSLLSIMVKEGGGQGEMFGNIQALGGLASFVSALMNSLLSGVSTIAPFIFCAISMAAVAIWTIRLPEAAKKFTDRKTFG
ncbi:MFS transporter [Spirosoma sp. BT702]|uniref:MFS transporter n=1 Tax=Spirosoma profusum TaxID=2771354 RepID=A0A927ARL9_9BACT|nr:MFS transporter [Spirosoma profusum]MBD2702461.1 MFS transporter [Spirosoma profusum]